MEAPQMCNTLHKATDTDFGEYVTTANKCLHVIRHINPIKEQEELDAFWCMLIFEEQDMVRTKRRTKNAMCGTA